MNLSPNRGRGECRVPAAPAASCAKCSKAHECRHHGHTGFTRHSLRNGFNGLSRALPGDEFVTVISGLRDCLSPVGPTRLRKFNTSNGCQDHTALPSAAIVVRLRAVDRSRAFRQPALRSRHTPNAAASTASHPASVTIAIRPSGGRDGEGSRTDLGQTGTGIFLETGLDSRMTDLPVGQISRPVRHSSKSESVTFLFIIDEGWITLALIGPTLFSSL